jgi:diguanylate cyclase (GGDEF)-like protein
VLVGVSHYIAAHLRPYDKMFRYGGEEFLLCLTDTDLSGGQVIVDRLRSELASLQFETKGKGPVGVTVSCGLALLAPELAVERSIDRADKALYAAKEGGRNRVVTWASNLDGEPPAGR